MMSDQYLPDLSRTAQALREYDAAVDSIPKRKWWEDGESEIERLERAVGRAYGEDTKDRNNPLTCEQCIRPGPKHAPVGGELSFVRRMVAKWEQQCSESKSQSHPEVPGSMSTTP